MLGFKLFTRVLSLRSGCLGMYTSKNLRPYVQSLRHGRHGRQMQTACYCNTCLFFLAKNGVFLSCSLDFPVLNMHLGTVECSSCAYSLLILCIIWVEFSSTEWLFLHWNLLAWKSWRSVTSHLFRILLFTVTVLSVCVVNSCYTWPLGAGLSTKDFCTKGEI